MARIFILCLLSSFSLLFGNEGGHPATWLEWFGSFHLIFVHFPIALINMLAVAEILYARSGRVIFDSASRFMLYAAAILTPMTAILGLLYSFTITFTGTLDTYMDLHMWFGIATTLLTLILLVIREVRGLGMLYYVSLALLFILVNFTGFFGGALVFGPEHMNFPAFLQ